MPCWIPMSQVACSGETCNVDTLAKGSIISPRQQWEQACVPGALSHHERGYRETELLVLGSCPSRRSVVKERAVRSEQGSAGDLRAGIWTKQSVERHLADAVEALEVLLQQGSYVDNQVFYRLLKRCVAERNLVLGSRIHALARRNRSDLNPFLANHIICMYASHGRLEEARNLFSEVDIPSRHMWASIIFAHARNGQPTEAIRFYRMMRFSKVEPDNHVFVAALKSCAAAGDLSFGREVHHDVLRSGIKVDAYLGNGLVDMYAKCRNLENARTVFDNLQAKDVVTWNAMIAGYAYHGLLQDALTLFASMQEEGIHSANSVTFVCLLQVCAATQTLTEGREIHLKIQEHGLEADGMVGNALVNMYAKCGSVEDARKVFQDVRSKDVITWTTMIAAYSQHGLGQEALDLYARMQEEGVTVPNHVTYVCLLQACSSCGSLHHGKQLHGEIQEKGLSGNIVVATGLLDMYFKCGSVEGAQRVFDNLAIKDVVTWTAMIAGYAQHGLGQEALALYARMQQEGIVPANQVTFVSLLQACGSVAGLHKGKEIHSLISRSGLGAMECFLASALIDMYAKCGSMADARQVFDSLTTKDAVTWNALVAGYAHQGESEIVFDLFRRLRDEGILPNGVTFLNVLAVCSHLGLVDKGQEFFESMNVDYGITPGIEHYNCMVDLFGRAGCLGVAVKVVDTMPLNPDVELWRSVLAACQKWGNVEIGRQAFECAVRLDENDAATFILMSNIFRAAHMHKEARAIRSMRLKAEAWKKPGQSWWTDVHGVTHSFGVGNRDHSSAQLTWATLEFLFVRMEEDRHPTSLSSDQLASLLDDHLSGCGYCKQV